MHLPILIDWPETHFFQHLGNEQSGHGAGRQQMLGFLRHIVAEQDRIVGRSPARGAVAVLPHRWVFRFGIFDPQAKTVRQGDGIDRRRFDPAAHECRRGDAIDRVEQVFGIHVHFARTPIDDIFRTLYSMLDFAATAFISVLFLVDPPATIPGFMALTASFSPARQRRTALVAAVAATVALMGFAAIGKILFQALGLTLPAFQIAGGLVLFVTSFKMINADSEEEKSEDMKDAREQLAESPPEPVDGPVSQIAITPLAIPFLAGPAAMSTVTVLMSQADTTLKVGFVYLAIALTGVICYVCLRLAGPIQKRMGKIGIHVLERVLGLVLAGIAVQFVLNGLVNAGVLPPLKA